MVLEIARSPLVEVVEVLSLLLSCLAAVEVDVEVVEDSWTTVLVCCWAASCWPACCWLLDVVTTVQPAPGASEQTLRGLTGVLVEPVAFCVERNVSSLLISVMMRWSTPLDAACCCWELSVRVSPALLWRSVAAVEEVTSVMTTELGCCSTAEVAVEAVLEEVTVRLLVDELTARCSLLVALLDAL